MEDASLPSADPSLAEMFEFIDQRDATPDADLFALHSEGASLFDGPGAQPLQAAAAEAALDPVLAEISDLPPLPSLTFTNGRDDVGVPLYQPPSEEGSDEESTVQHGWDRDNQPLSRTQPTDANTVARAIADENNWTGTAENANVTADYPSTSSEYTNSEGDAQFPPAMVAGTGIPVSPQRSSDASGSAPLAEGAKSLRAVPTVKVEPATAGTSSASRGRRNAPDSNPSSRGSSAGSYAGNQSSERSLEAGSDDSDDDSAVPTLEDIRNAASPEEAQRLKRARRLYQNRKSAQQSRKRKKSYVVSLEEGRVEAVKENKVLHERIQYLEEENELFRQELIKRGVDTASLTAKLRMRSRAPKRLASGARVAVPLFAVFLCVTFLVSPDSLLLTGPAFASTGDTGGVQAPAHARAVHPLAEQGRGAYSPTASTARSLMSMDSKAPVRTSYEEGQGSETEFVRAPARSCSADSHEAVLLAFLERHFVSHKLSADVFVNTCARLRDLGFLRSIEGLASYTAHRRSFGKALRLAAAEFDVTSACFHNARAFARQVELVAQAWLKSPDGAVAVYEGPSPPATGPLVPQKAKRTDVAIPRERHAPSNSSFVCLDAMVVDRPRRAHGEARSEVASYRSLAHAEKHDARADKRAVHSQGSCHNKPLVSFFMSASVLRNSSIIPDSISDHALTGEWSEVVCRVVDVRPSQP